MIIAWENASSRFNRAFRIPSQEFLEAITDQPRGLAGPNR
jgi:hypothetical protein